MIQNPADIRWIEGDLPDVSQVPKDCIVLAWFVSWYPDPEEWKHACRHWRNAPAWEDVHDKLRRIELVKPYENELNSLKWCDSLGHPTGYQEKVKYWAWVYHPIAIGSNLGELS